MKAVMISIRPEWTERIHRGDKIWELRKSVPRPAEAHLIKVHNYETKANGGQGKVVSEWILREYTVYFDDMTDGRERNQICKNACVSNEQLSNYFNKGKRKVIYCWKIEHLKIYDSPKELSEFGLTNPPQSWCYVEELEAK